MARSALGQRLAWSSGASPRDGLAPDLAELGFGSADPASRLGERVGSHGATEGMGSGPWLRATEGLEDAVFMVGLETWRLDSETISADGAKAARPKIRFLASLFAGVLSIDRY